VGWLFGAIVLLTGVVFLTFGVGHYFFDFSEASYRQYWPHRGYLLMHILGGAVALVTGPFQLWSGLRRRVLKVHRALGKLYLAGVLVGSAGAFYMASVSPIPTFGVALTALGIVWLIVSSMAFIAIRNRRIEVHKEWMIRSYVVTYAFVTFRVVDESGVLAGLGLERLATTAWVSWSIPLLLTEVALQWKRVVRGQA
jgi:uncharacterized membrane protein